MVELQYRTFTLVTLSSVIIYVIALAFVAYYVNFVGSWNYDANVILSNLEFNAAILTISAMGFVSLILSLHPKWHKLIIACGKSFQGLESETEIETENITRVGSRSKFYENQPK